VIITNKETPKETATAFFKDGTSVNFTVYKLDSYKLVIEKNEKQTIYFNRNIDSIIFPKIIYKTIDISNYY
jgi:sRNA-binding regulator protein Hfq